MTKRPRRHSPAERVHYLDAAWYEFDGWPNAKLREEFWQRPDIPDELREPPPFPASGSPGDPRYLLSDDPAIREAAERACEEENKRRREFYNKRIDWLHQAAEQDRS